MTEPISRAFSDRDKPDLDELAKQPWPFPGQDGDLAGTACPPCTGNCRQGRDCDAEDDDPLAFFVGLRNALILTLAAVGVWHILSRVFG